MVSTDIGNICSVSNSYLRFDQPRSFFAAMSFGNCGYAFPCAMGAKLGAPDRYVFLSLPSYRYFLTCHPTTLRLRVQEVPG